MSDGRFEGVVEAFNVREGKGGYSHGYRINGEWYNLGFQQGQDPLWPKGTVIAGEYKTYGTRKYINARSVEVKSSGATSSASGSSTFQAGNDARQDSIMRQNAMAHAALLVAQNYARDMDPVDAAELVVRLAETVFFPYAKNGVNAVASEAEDANNQRRDEDTGSDDEVPF